ncbi:c-type cytochrome [Marinoscillum furvescens]|uniref:Cytochrome c n=1 Tax=Marinoscillum furvescens DSM 4134 TaxID=1122208 RepID=A0A3D9L3X8_MARFU|nr:c-type cytochrome [Marinoscillum furvescens]REE00118.1 cytochrome c [Marinoscillum furvescens DSM 4134]
MKILKILGILALTVLLLIAGATLYVSYALPNVGEPKELTVTPTPELIQRGAYLANSVAVCMDCHSKRDFSKFSGPITAASFGTGGDVFDHNLGFPGVFTAKNITPAGIGDWTDGELYRLITTGVTREGKPIFPVMPYTSYGKMADEDVQAIIAYLRTLPAKSSEIPPSKADFPMNLIMKTIPKPADPQPLPDRSDVLAYGKYLTTIAACADCHTPQDKGAPIEGMHLAGGFEFKLPGFGVVRSANITPDTRYGIGSWTEDFFVQRFKQYADSTYQPHQIAANEFQTVMPWLMYATMEEEDLKAIYQYLKSVDPVGQEVVRFTPESELLAME